MIQVIRRSIGTPNGPVRLGRQTGQCRVASFQLPPRTLAALAALALLGAGVVGCRRPSRSAPASMPLIATLRGHTHEVLALVFSPDSTRVATKSRDRTALW